MAVGDVFVWETDQAIGYGLRRKYHVYICEGGWREEGYAFLFISSSDYGGDYAIKASEYAFLDHDSFLSCGGMVFYTAADLAAAQPQRVGRLQKQHLSELLDNIESSDFMERWQIKLAIEAIQNAIKP